MSQPNASDFKNISTGLGQSLSSWIILVTPICTLLFHLLVVPLSSE